MLILSWDVVWGYKVKHKKRKKKTNLNAQRGQWCITWMAPFMSPTYHKHNAEGSRATPWNAFRNIWHSAFLGFVFESGCSVIESIHAHELQEMVEDLYQGIFQDCPFSRVAHNKRLPPLDTFSQLCVIGLSLSIIGQFGEMFGAAESPIYFITKLFFVPNCRSRMLLIIHY